MAETKTTSGSGSNNGVSYSYTLKTSSLSGRYECLVHRHFLDSNVERVLTDTFTIVGSQWKLLMKKAAGKLKLFLQSENQECTEVCCGLEVINHSNSSNNERRGTRHLFEPGSCVGFGNVLPISDAVAPNVGYLLGGCITVVVNVGLILPENESLVISSRGKPVIVTWQLRHLNKLANVVVFSKEFKLANATWKLRLHPLSRESVDEEDVYSIYLYCTAEHSIQTTFRVTLINHIGEKQNKTRELTHMFTVGSSNWGWSGFVGAKQVSDPNSGFVKDGWVTFIAYISINNPAKQRPSRSSVQNEIEGKCVVCLVNEQTSGFLHRESSHRCVCADCCRLLRERGSRCPICNVRVDAAIINYY